MTMGWVACLAFLQQLRFFYLLFMVKWTSCAVINPSLFCKIGNSSFFPQSKPVLFPSLSQVLAWLNSVSPHSGLEAFHSHQLEFWFLRQYMQGEQLPLLKLLPKVQRPSFSTVCVQQTWTKYGSAIFKKLVLLLLSAHDVHDFLLCFFMCQLQPHGSEEGIRYPWREWCAKQ